MSLNVAELRGFTKHLCQISAAEIAPRFCDPDLTTELKGNKTIITEADREAERVLRRAIKQEYPDHGIIGEEFGNEREDAEYVWVLDPIDGTISFASGCPLFGTLIACLHRGQPFIGAINQPVAGQLCIGDNKHTTLNGRPVKVRENIKSLSEAALLTTDVVPHIEQYQGKAEYEKFQKLMGEVKLFRTWGDCYGYLLVASGFADIMMDPKLEVWDLMALIPIIRGAGGTITAWDGSPVIKEDGTAADSTLAAPAQLHAEVLKVMG